MTKCPHCGKTFDDDLLIQDAPTRKAQADEIYKLYPRKVAKPAAIKSIEKALKGIAFVELKKRVAQLALMWDNADTSFMPHAATWFNQERFNDDPSTWMPRKQLNGPPLWKQVEILRDAIEVHPANPEWLRYDQDQVTQAHKDEYKRLKEKLAAAEQQQRDSL